MKTLLIVFVLFVTVFTDENIKEMDQGTEAKDEGKPDIKIEVTHKPDTCNDEARKTQRLDVLSMKYIGKLEDGTQFESTYEHKQEFTFQLGVGQVIAGWERGLLGMCVGEKRTLTVPPNLAYGDIGAGDKIPPKATLIFEVELSKIDDGPKPKNVFKEIDANGDGQLSQEEVSNFLVKNSQEAGEHIDADSEEHKKMMKNIFEHEDKDKDGFISMEEFSGPKHDEL